MKKVIAHIYDTFLRRRHRFIRLLLWCCLIASIIIGAGQRAVVLKQNYEVWNDFGMFLSLASHFPKTLGRYSHKEYYAIKENPDSYIYTKGKSAFKPKNAIDNEMGWPIILSLILKEGTQGVHNLALTVVRYQAMLELFVIILLFWIGKSLAGFWGALFASFLYSVFKMPMVLMSWVVYYYWPIPFSALSLLFWAGFYLPENNHLKERIKFISFFVYGLIMGLAAITRLYFIFLPLALSPFVFFKERVFKKAIILIVVMLTGQLVILGLQVACNMISRNTWRLSTRGTWHTVIQGLGAYENPWGITDTGDLTLAEWVLKRGGPNLRKVGIRPYDRFCKKEVIKLFRERPDIFMRNAFRNFKAGITISPHFFSIAGHIESPQAYYRFNKQFPWLILSSFIILFFVNRQRFWIAFTLLAQGFYLLFSVLVYFPNYIPFIASYIPVFVVLLALSLAVYVKLALALFEGVFRCWVYKRRWRTIFAVVAECYCQDWSKEHHLVDAKDSQ